MKIKSYIGGICIVLITNMATISWSISSDLTDFNLNGKIKNTPDATLINIQNNYSTMMTPDRFNFYQLMLIKMHIYIKNRSLPERIPLSTWNQVEKKQIQTIVKIIKETPLYFIIKLPRYCMVNWGSGPTLSSPYACLKKIHRRYVLS